jgi:hypothetical protein
MKFNFIYPISLVALALLFWSCDDLLEDTDLNPIYFVECEIDGEKFRAQTNNNAWLSWTGIVGGEYTIIGQNVTVDKSIVITLFEQLGEGEISTGVNVNSYLTDISYFHDNKTYLANENGGGTIFIESLTDEEAVGTFEGILGELNGNGDPVVITKGKFKVKTR